MNLAGDIGLEVGPSPDVLFVVKTDSQVTLLNCATSQSLQGLAHLQTSSTMLVTCVMALASILPLSRLCLSQVKAKRLMVLLRSCQEQR